MSYNKQIANRVREILQVFNNVEEKKMMGGLTFMLNDKMCVGILKDELMCRIDPELHEILVEKEGCRTMSFTKRQMIGYILIDEFGIKKQEDLEYWVNLAIEFNPKAKSTKK